MTTIRYLLSYSGPIVFFGQKMLVITPFLIIIFQSAVESKKGVAGYRQTQDDLEKVSALKSNLDHQKGQTLEEISDMVKVLTQSIAEKKGALAPIIKELRPLRQRSQVLD